MIKAVVFDLDDTLYPELDYVKSGFRTAEKEIKKRYGIGNTYDELIQLFRQDKSNVFNRFLEKHDLAADDNAVNGLLNVYRKHKPAIELFDDVKDIFAELKARGYKLGIITDGRPEGQRAKITALGIEKFVDKIIITDELGGIEYRKPNPKAFEIICSEFGILPEEMMYVGDNPQKDFAVKKYLPIVTVRIDFNVALYSKSKYAQEILPDYEITSFAHISKLLRCGS